MINEKKVLDKKQKKERAVKLAAQAETARIKAEAAAAAIRAEDEAEAAAEDNENEYVIEAIKACKKGPNGLVYWIKWQGFTKPEDNTWEPEHSLHSELVSDYKRDHPHEVAEAEAGEVEIEIAGDDEGEGEE